jgi:predicted AAA+ superfamily ATPase
VVLLNGPRQSGKTTLVRQFASEQRPYLTLDDATTCSAAREDPQGFIRRLDGALIDEVQRVPERLLVIKLAVDERRRPGRFLLTGSADVMALPGVADSLPPEQAVAQVGEALERRGRAAISMPSFNSSFSIPGC